MDVGKPNKIVAKPETDHGIGTINSEIEMEQTEKKLGDNKENNSSMHISEALTVSQAGIKLHNSKPIHVNLSGKEDDNFKHMLAYPKKLTCMFVGGCISLLGGSVA